MIITILNTAAHHDIGAAREFTAEHLHLPLGNVSEVVAVAYVLQHFEQGSYSGWDGFVEMREADRHSIEQYNERKANDR